MKKKNIEDIRIMKSQRSYAERYQLIEEGKRIGFIKIIRENNWKMYFLNI